MSLKQSPFDVKPRLAISRLSRSQRSVVAQLRSGIILVAIEIGRLKIFRRKIELCDLGEIESVSHFLLYWKYSDNLSFETLKYSSFDVFKFANFVSTAWRSSVVVLFENVYVAV